ncbi:MAG: ABC transporter ATP-binding protein [Candidatus Omnitrophota bacterium]|nr:ABC transporter ATP-binding protein [Candidatus Omnitrophota bacterium]
MREYKRFIKFLKPHSGILALAVIFMGISSLFDWVSLAMIVPVSDKILNNGKVVFPFKLPGAVENIVGLINSMPQAQLLKWLIIFIPILFFLKGLFNFIYSYYMSDIGQLCVRDIRGRLYEKLQGMSLEYYTSRRSGELISRITNDVKLVENALSYGTTDLVYQSFLVVLFSFTIFFIHWKLAIISLLLIPFIAFPIVKVGKVLRKISRTSQEKMADINSLLVETINGVRIVKAFCMEPYEINKFRTQNQGYYKLAMRSIKRTLLLSPATEFIGILSGVFVLSWAGKDVISGKLSFGVLGLYLGSLFSLIRPFKKLSQVNSINQQALAANDRIYEVLDAPITVKEKENAGELKRISRNIEFKNLNFRYEELEILKDINFSVSAGEVIAIVGPSGSGKSTLLDLLARFYDPQKGEILIDGINIRDVSLRSLRGQIGIVTQETILFNDSVRANISYGQTDMDIKLIEEASRTANAQGFISKLPQGYDTFIGDRGVKLSGGERQRLAIARALLKNPPILILDEATSQLDTESERIVQDALNKLMRGRTVFMIAHRLSTVRGANKIIVLDKGRIVQMGSHQDLISAEGLYRRLWQMQNLEEK